MRRPDSFTIPFPWLKYAILLASAVPFNLAALDHSLLLTGEIYSRKAQVIIVPLTTNWQAGISKMVEEGQAVNPGDVVIEFDGAEAAGQLEQQRETTRAEKAKTERDLARLEKDLVQASFALRLAELELELTELRASTPEGLIGAIEFSENQLAWEKAAMDLADSRKQLEGKGDSLRERRRQAELDQKKAELSETWWAEMLASFTVKATQSGYVIYGNHPWTRSKFQEGDNVRTSFHVAQVADTSELAIKVWINSVDRPHIKTGTTVEILLDALPEILLEGTLDSISDSGSKRQEWGEAVYFEGVVSFDANSVPGLLPGMSARVEASVMHTMQYTK